jgi:hypothetical protein
MPIYGYVHAIFTPSWRRVVFAKAAYYVTYTERV